MLKPRVLIADPDRDFLQKLLGESSQVEVSLESELKATQLAIADPKFRYSAICINTSLCAPSAIPLVRFVKVHRPATSLHLISDTAPGPLNSEELKQLHVHSQIEKPVTAAGLMQTLIPGNYFNLAEALEVSRTDITKAGDTREADDGQMHAIDAKAFLCGQKSFFDVYVKISEAKYLMVLKAGDQFEPERLLNYLNRGVKSFFIKREAQLFYLQYCDKITAAMLSSASVPIESKISQLQNLGRETSEYLKTAGISESTLTQAGTFVQHTNSLVKMNGLAKHDFVKAFLENAAQADHGTSTVMVVSMMIKSLGFTDDKVIGLIGLGAMVHDIGLLGVPETIRAKYEKGEELTEDERKTFETHPQLGADMLMKVPHVNPLLPQIALQHHERRTRHGFPGKLGSGSISSAAELVGLADHFLDLVRRKNQDSVWSPVELIKRQSADEFSLKIIDAFTKAMAEK